MGKHVADDLSALPQMLLSFEHSDLELQYIVRLLEALIAAPPSGSVDLSSMPFKPYRTITLNHDPI
jgi:hypothetical protein